MTKATVNNAVFISDTHVGDQMGLCPPTGAVEDGGGKYLPNRIQRAIWAAWRKFWDDEVPVLTRGEPYVVVHVGDVIEGRHHNATHQFTHNLADQAKLAEDILRPVIRAKNCRGYYQLRGTGAHAGPSAEQEESLARALGAVPNEDGQYARPELWLRVGTALCHIMHHIGTTGVSHYETSAVHRELIESFNEAARWSDEPPNFVVRAHRHRFARTEIDGFKHGQHVMFCSFVLPGWQAKTSYAFKIAGARTAPPQFGGAVIRQGDEEAYMRAVVWNFRRSKVVLAGHHTGER